MFRCQNWSTSDEPNLTPKKVWHFIVPDGFFTGKYPLKYLMGAEERIDVDLDAGMEEDAMRPRIRPKLLQ